MTKSSIYAFGSGDMRVQFWYGDQKEISIVVHLSRFVCENLEDGSSYGVFEIGTVMYDEEQDIFEKREDGNPLNRADLSSSEIDISVFPKKWILNPLIKCEGVRIRSKSMSFCASGVVHTQYCFSNRPDWKDHTMVLPEPDASDRNADPLYRIARALEGIQKTLDVPKSRVKTSMDDVTLSVEEYTDLRLNGKVPERYQDVGDEVKWQFRK